MIYHGAWENGKKSQLGLHYYPDNAHYFGYWLNDLKSGKGKLSFKNGQFVGNWEKDQRQGLGTLRKT